MSTVNSIEWTTDGIQALNDFKKSILRKKIMLNIIITSYSKYDKIFRYIHMFLALATPLMVLISQMVSDSMGKVETPSIVISSIVAGMIKLKDYLKFDNTKENAKQQTVKYGQLFQRIDREIRKPIDKRQHEDEFIYWVNREFIHLELNDPDLPHSLKDDYIALCKDKNIPYDEDIEILTNMIQVERSTMERPVPEQNANHQFANERLTQSQLAQSQLAQSHLTQTHLTQPQITSNQTNTINTLHNSSNIMEENKPVAMKRSGSIISKVRSLSDERDRIEYHEQIKTLDTSKDLQWAIDRLNTI